MYRFRAQIPVDNAGRLMADMQRIGADFSLPDILDENTAVIEGRGTASKLQDYQQEVAAYTKGAGSFSVVFDATDLVPISSRWQRRPATIPTRIS